MNRSVLLFLGLACLIVVASTQAFAQEDAEMSAFLEQQSTSDAQFESALSAELGDLSETFTQTEKPAFETPKKNSGAGGVYKGGKPRKTGANLRKGAADGSTLPPYDPFRIRRRHVRRIARADAKRQAKVDRENQISTCRKMRERREKREAAERAEAAEEKAELAKEAARKKRVESVVETDLMEISADMEADADADAETQTETAMEFEAEADMEAEMQAEMEAAADSEESANDMNEMEADVMSGDLLEADADLESEAEEAALVETDATPIVTRKAGLRPSSHVTYARGDLADENVDNGDSRAVFKRRARGQEIVRFEKRLQSSAGQAVVTGVTKMPCGKDITDKGLFGAVVSENPGATVAAANPNPPKWVDDNIDSIKRLPIVPEFHSEGGVDEYGDPL